MPHYTENERTGAVGVTLLQLLVEKDLGWIFRRNYAPDTGLDAQIEVVLGDEASGLVLGLQVKTGASYFSSETKDGWRYRGDYSHLRYWREHNLAVLLVLVDEQKQEAYWAHIGQDTQVHEAENSWTIEIMRANHVRQGCRRLWMDLAWAADPQDALLRYCMLQRAYMTMLLDGGRVAVEVLEWNNKTRGQAAFEVVLEGADGQEIRRDNLFVFAGAHDIRKHLQILFPWADVEVDEEYYEDHEDVQPEAVFQDSDSPEGYVTFAGERPTGPRPYKDDGEASNYRFLLTLNGIGKAFCTLSSCAEGMTNYPPYYAARVLVRQEE